ncbi:MAG: hypothetical protein V1721_10265 [Pseudomonadota bacterium]
MRLLMLLLPLAVLSLGSCADGHSTLKAPCGPVSSFWGSPCAHQPLNGAPLRYKGEEELN